MVEPTSIPALDPASLMDKLIGASKGVRLLDSGPAAHRFAQLVEPAERAEPLIAGVFWWAVWQGDLLMDSLLKHDVDPKSVHALLVAHAHVTRFDLLLLADDYSGDPVRLPLRFYPEEVSDQFGYLRKVPRGTAADRIRQRYPQVSDDLVHDFIREVALAGEFGAVLAAKPDLDPTGVPDPAVNVLDLNSDREARAGLVLRHNGQLYATSAMHTFSGIGSKARVGSADGEVIREDIITDSCLIQLDEDPQLPLLQGFAGVMRGILPPLGEPAWFGRPDDGRINTVVQMADMSILSPQQNFASKIYTLADTRNGDSGVALLDTSNRVLGFAVYRTGISARLPFSQWIYAEQSLAALGMLDVV